MTTLTIDTPVGDIAARHPSATRVFARPGIDFCCGGGVALRQACDSRGLAAAAVLAEIDEALSGARGPQADWLAAPLGDVVLHIVETFHVPLRSELPRLQAMARKVAQVHAERDPEGRLPQIRDTLAAFTAELEDHMAREERLLFPAILGGNGGAPVAPFLDDHEAAGRSLARLRALTGDYTPPAGACNTWRALWAGLADLESAMHEHVHLENNVLFARASRGPETGDS